MPQLIPDKVNSSYWWIVNLDPLHPDNRTDKITGYSKFQKQREANCKNHVFMSKMEMLYKNGYFKRCKSIDIYRRVAPLPSIQEDPLMITLYPDDYTIPANYIDKVPLEVKQYLQKFYGRMLRGLDVQGLRPLKDHKKESNDNIFDITQHKFKTFLELDQWAENKIAEGHAPGQVWGFMRSYSQKYF
jgi:hypothetical protein